MNRFFFGKSIKGSALLELFQDIFCLFLCLDQDSFNLRSQRDSEFFLMGLVVICNILIAHLYFPLNKFFSEGICQDFIRSSLYLIGNFGIFFKAVFFCFSRKDGSLYQIINPSLPYLLFFLIRGLSKNRRNNFFFKSLIPYFEKNTFFSRNFVYLCLCVIFICKFFVFLPEQFITNVCLCLIKGYLPFITFLQDFNNLIPSLCLYNITEFILFQVKSYFLKFRFHPAFIKPAETAVVFI